MLGNLIAKIGLEAYVRFLLMSGSIKPQSLFAGNDDVISLRFKRNIVDGLKLSQIYYLVFLAHIFYLSTLILGAIHACK